MTKTVSAVVLIQKATKRLKNGFPLTAVEFSSDAGKSSRNKQLRSIPYHLGSLSLTYRHIHVHSLTMWTPEVCIHKPLLSASDTPHIIAMQGYIGKVCRVL